MNLCAKITFTAALLFSCAVSPAGTSINPTNKFAYGADIGWVDWRGDTNNGAVIGEFVCSGYLYSANLGWIHLGDGSPVNGIQYLNNSATDYGINTDGLGNLRGFAYSANVGWINFEANGAPHVDLKTGRLLGSIYSANCGWLSLSNAFAVVRTDSIPGGLDSNGNGLPDAWERTYFGGLGVNPNADADADGMSNKQEYLAGTNPTNAIDRLVITSFGAVPSGITTNTVTWRSVLTRDYFIQTRLDLGSGNWVDSGLGVIHPTDTLSTRTFTLTNTPARFFRVQANRPLAP